MDPGSLITQNSLQIYIALDIYSLAKTKKKKKIVKIVGGRLGAGLYDAKTMLRLNLIETESLTALHDEIAWEILKKRNFRKILKEPPVVCSTLTLVVTMQNLLECD